MQLIFFSGMFESTSELDCKGDNTPMGTSSLHSKLIHHDDMVYESWIDF